MTKFNAEKAELLFIAAGFVVTAMRDVHNQYWGADAHESKWVIVVANGYTFLIGWRKRVIHIEIVNPPKGFSFAGLILDDVTKETSMIHAWTYEKAIQYLRSAFTKLKTMEVVG